ncbi:hypothetical protein MLD38_032071 [Melastoma candidum]|uniref:Uncharacterized protein n=1 Tax=Melastoma candidum TaxID=119954 RepID=A0ACB9M4X9_9MYRT|nr:hypothetical protein MLD38_032071 [Melastoma candidum]
MAFSFSLLTSKAHFLGLRLYVVIILALFALCLTVSFLAIALCIWLSRRSRLLPSENASGTITLVSKDVGELTNVEHDLESLMKRSDAAWEEEEEADVSREGRDTGATSSSMSRSGDTVLLAVEALGNMGWGRWYTLKELEIMTAGFSEENVIGEGGHGVVYRGVLDDGSAVAVKELLNNKKSVMPRIGRPCRGFIWLWFISLRWPCRSCIVWGQAEREFKVEVEAIGKVRHKNLVGLLGYCAEGSRRMLVYEYVDNGNLEHWLHDDIRSTRPLSWEIRMRIAIGTARGLAYLHEGLEPKVVHRDVKSSNILLDRKWNPKVSDFGLAKLLGSEATYVTTRVMGTFGYVSPEYASTGMLNEGSDVYSFGVLLMELITGRTPVDYSRPTGETNIVEWFKGIVANQCVEEIFDPLMTVPPSARALKRVVLVCLRCVDTDACKRPKMGQIVHMLEGQQLDRVKEIPTFQEEPRRLPRTHTPSKLGRVPEVDRW